MKRIPPGTVVPQGTHGVFSRMMDGPPHYDHVDLWNRDFKVPEDSWVQWYYDGPKSDMLRWELPSLLEEAEMWLLAHPDAEDLAILDWVEKAKD